MSGASVFFYVQHLLGIGHLRRAATLARALSQGGLDVTLASGGMAIPVEELGGAKLVQLPAVRATDMSFKQLVDAGFAVILPHAGQSPKLLRTTD